MKKFKVELQLVYTVEAENENDARGLIDGMRNDNFLPVGYWAEEEEIAEVAPKIEFNKREIQSQKDQSITELNEAIMAAPEDAAKLLTSFIRE